MCRYMFWQSIFFLGVAKMKLETKHGFVEMKMLRANINRPVVFICPFSLIFFYGKQN